MRVFPNNHPFAPWNRWPAEGPWEDPRWRDDPDAPWNRPCGDLRAELERWNDSHPDDRIQLPPASRPILDKLPGGTRSGAAGTPRPARRHSFDSKYDFGFRPESYWPEGPLTEEMLSKVKGTARRDVVRRALAGEELTRLGDAELYRKAMELVQKESLEPAERDRWGGIHPALMGGEYLPEFEEDEIEIARIEFASTTGDVIQVRAKPDLSLREGALAIGIRYRVVDEYEAEGSCLDCSPETSAEPLTFAEVVDLVDSIEDGSAATDSGEGYPDAFRTFNYEQGGDPDSLVHFLTVKSWLYPQLEAYYEERAEEWYWTIGS